MDQKPSFNSLSDFLFALAEQLADLPAEANQDQLAQQLGISSEEWQKLIQLLQDIFALEPEEGETWAHFFQRLAYLIHQEGPSVDQSLVPTNLKALIRDLEAYQAQIAQAHQSAQEQLQKLIAAATDHWPPFPPPAQIKPQQLLLTALSLPPSEAQKQIEEQLGSAKASQLSIQKATQIAIAQRLASHPSFQPSSPQKALKQAQSILDDQNQQLQDLGLTPSQAATVLHHLWTQPQDQLIQWLNSQSREIKTKLTPFIQAQPPELVIATELVAQQIMPQLEQSVAPETNQQTIHQVAHEIGRLMINRSAQGLKPSESAFSASLADPVGLILEQHQLTLKQPLSLDQLAAQAEPVLNSLPPLKPEVVESAARAAVELALRQYFQAHQLQFPETPVSETTAHPPDSIQLIARFWTQPLSPAARHALNHPAPLPPDSRSSQAWPTPITKQATKLTLPAQLARFLPGSDPVQSLAPLHRHPSFLVAQMNQLLKNPDSARLWVQIHLPQPQPGQASPPFLIFLQQQQFWIQRLTQSSGYRSLQRLTQLHHSLTQIWHPLTQIWQPIQNRLSSFHPLINRISHHLPRPWQPFKQQLTQRIINKLGQKLAQAFVEKAGEKFGLTALAVALGLPTQGLSLGVLALIEGVKKVGQTVTNFLKKIGVDQLVTKINHLFSLGLARYLNPLIDKTLFFLPQFVRQWTKWLAALFEPAAETVPLALLFAALFGFLFLGAQFFAIDNFSLAPPRDERGGGPQGIGESEIPIQLKKVTLDPEQCQGLPGTTQGSCLLTAILEQCLSGEGVVNFNVETVINQCLAKYQNELEQAGLDYNHAISEIRFSAQAFVQLQCVGYKRALEPNLPRCGNAKDFVNCQLGPRCRYVEPSQVQPGDNAIWDWAPYGHIAMVISVDQEQKRILVAQAWGDSGRVNFREFGIATVERFIRCQ